MEQDSTHNCAEKKIVTLKYLLGQKVNFILYEARRHRDGVQL
jgi:hypothetical protein